MMALLWYWRGSVGLVAPSTPALLLLDYALVLSTSVQLPLEVAAPGLGQLDEFFQSFLLLLGLPAIQQVLDAEGRDLPLELVEQLDRVVAEVSLGGGRGPLGQVRLRPGVQAHHVDLLVHLVGVELQLGLASLLLVVVVLLERLHVDVDPLGRQLLLLLLQLFEQLLLPPVPLLPLQLFVRDRLPGAGLGVGVVGRAARTLLRVLLLAELGTTILEPYLKNGIENYNIFK